MYALAWTMKILTSIIVTYRGYNQTKIENLVLSEQQQKTLLHVCKGCEQGRTCVKDLL